ncbi:MAG TPA: ABC transporter ATP-binding protein [Tepidisphaeraceae bacterium]|nr:ABC transporter ATP-binding protein [Tepidisphaeraceae bacterium]
MSSVKTLTPPQDREKYRRDKKNNAYFWRALSYLRPYRGMVIVSIVCALFVGVAMTGGLATMLPIIRLLINGDTVPAWVNRAIVDNRLQVHLDDAAQSDQVDAQSMTLTLLRVDRSGLAGAAGYRPGDQFVGKVPAAELLKEMADPNRKSITLVGPDGLPRYFTLLPAVPFYLVWAQAAAYKLPADPVWAIVVVFGVLAAFSIVGNVIRFFQEFLSDKAAILAVNDIRRHLYDRILHVPLSHFTEQGTSDATSRLTVDSMNLQDGFKQVLGQTIQEPIKAAFAFAFAMVMSWRLTLFILFFGPVMAVIVRKFGKKMRRASRKALQESSSMLGQLEATMLGIRVVKGVGSERFERRRYTNIMRGLVEQQIRMSRIDAFSTPTMETLTLLVAGCIIIFASYLVLRQHTLQSGVFIAVMVALMTIGESLRRIGKVNNSLQQSNAAAARIFEAMDLPIEHRKSLPRKVEAKKLPLLSREIRFEDVEFTYPGSSNPALCGVNLTVEKGSSIAIVGRNGSGKTTLLALLPRFFDPQSGRIAIDGVDLRDATLRSLRRQIMVVTQESVIFPGTIAENIAYGHPLAFQLDKPWPAVAALRKEIEVAARRAFAHDFIMEKPNGYDTPLGEMGGSLSGGQKQRICIARAILRNSPILILDEATSQVDAESEHLIQQAIEGLMQHAGPPGQEPQARTMFVIAHRFSTIKSADFIVVMDRGLVVGQGQHEELMASCPTYKQLYERQLQGVKGVV